MNFSTSLNFTSSNEDGRTELDALALTPKDRVLCLTASGTRPLDLLLGDPGQIVALDVNPAQNHLLRLKIAAFQTLTNVELYAYLGIEDGIDRCAVHKRVEQALCGPAREFWDTKKSLIREGVWNTGRWERVLRFFAGVLRQVRGRHIERLFSAANIEEQEAIWAECFDDWFWNYGINLLSSRFFWTHLIGEPGGRHLPNRTASARRLTSAFRDASRRFLFRHSDFATLIFHGRHSPQRALPLHLQAANLDRVRSRLDRIEIRTGDLATMDRAQIGEFSAYSLSDFGSYCDRQAYDQCWHGVIETAERDARYCERIFMNHLTISEELTDQILIDKALSNSLSAMDRAIIYDIRTGTLRPGRASTG